MNHPSIRTGLPVSGMPAIHTAGMTFIELLVVIALAGFMLMVAIPSFDALLTNSRLTTITNTYITSLHLARSEATKLNARVTLCKSADGASCTANSRWDQGWLVFHDINNNAQVDAGEMVIRAFEALPANFLLQGNAPVANYVSYASTGGARTTNGAFQAGTLTLCRASTDQTEARSIIISSTGRARVQTTTVLACPGQ